MPISKSQEIEINIVGSSTFGRYPKISLEKTYNMFISDEWLINYAGFKKRKNFTPSGEGRGLFNSTRGGFLIAVIDNAVYRIDSNLFVKLIGNLGTSTGEVYIDENLRQQICIVDGTDAYIYFYGTVPSFTAQNLPTHPMHPFNPSYVCYHATYFLFGSNPEGTATVLSADWYAYEYATDSTIQFVELFTLQTKPDSALVVQRIPGRGNNVLVIGSIVGEVWTLVGGTEIYRRVSSFNIDNGLVSISTLAANEDYVCWLAQNENNAPFIMITDGSSAKRISTDGIDHVLDQIQFPQKSDAFFYRQDGHLFYQLTFYDPVDNLSLIYDFSTGQFFHVSDENLNYHPARKIAFFDEKTYFISLNDGSLYQMDSNFVTYDYSTSLTSVGEEIPRIRICKTVRKRNSSRFRVGQFTFWIEQGMPNQNPSVRPRVDLSYSIDGNATFSNIVSRELNLPAIRKNQIRWWSMGQANELTIQLRFWGFTRMVVNNGYMEIY